MHNMPTQLRRADWEEEILPSLETGVDLEATAEGREGRKEGGIDIEMEKEGRRKRSCAYFRRSEIRTLTPLPLSHAFHSYLSLLTPPQGAR